MPYVPCGGSGLRLPRLSLGLWHNFGGTDDWANQRAMVRAAFDRGITHFDLANNYGPPPGAAEENFGRLLREDFAAHRDELIISTKAGYRMGPGPYGDGGSRKYLLSSLDQSLRRLGLDYVDIFYHHRRDRETPLAETMGALADAVRRGRALYVGISNYDAASTRAAAAILRDMGVPLLIHQPVYNMLKRDVETGLLPVLAELGVGCIPFSPLAQGLLTNRYLQDIPADSRAAGSSVFLSPDRITPELQTRLRALADIAAARGVSLAQLAVLWLWRRPEITTVLIGASRPTQIEDLGAATTQPPLDAGELTHIERVLVE
jgi:L-glyceraldehyde 3-phosphate reductase